MPHIIIVLGVIAAIGVIAWAICYAIPMNPLFKRIVVAIAVVAAVLYTLKALGIFDGRLNI